MSKNKAIKFSPESLELADRWFNPNHSLNREFQKKKLKENKEFFDKVGNNPLNDSQRRAVILDEHRNLVIAGAGTGKTSTLVAKLGYILKERLALPSEILILAFNADAKDEINHRIRKDIFKGDDFEIEAKTFHSFGREVIESVERKTPVTSRWADKGKSNEYNNFLREKVDNLLTNSRIKPSIISLLTWELTPYPIEKELLFTSMGEYRKFISEFDLVALNGNTVKSYGELLIANYLFTQGIPFTYEARYKSATKNWPSFQYYPDFHLDNTNVYIEYFGTDRLGATAPFIDSHKYRKEIESKKACHSNFKTKLIDLYYYDLKEKNLLSRLKEEIKSHDIPCNPRSEEEILEAFRKQHYTTRLIELFKRFRKLFKSDGHSFERLRAQSKDNFRSSSLLNIFENLYESYENELQSYNGIDFIDMVNKGTHYIKTGEYKTRFKYILVDEYQDLSPQRYRLINALLERNPDVKLYNVGDDWQCIYGFTGSDIKYTTNFSEYYGSLSKVHLNETFRFNQSLCDLAASIIAKNKNQIRKDIKAKNKDLEKACIIHRYEFNEKNALMELIKDISDEKEDGNTLLILGRNKADLPRGEEIKTIKKTWGDGKVTVKTCHSSKGLEADYVILHKLQDQFPSTREDDPIIKLILNENSSPKEEEERRLLYVSLTRAKKKVHITTDVKATSKFVYELLESENKVELIEHFNKPPKECVKCESSEIFQHELKSGKKDRKYIYSCNNCDYESFNCPSCHRGQALLIQEEGKYYFECERQCGLKHQVCEKCGTGYLRRPEGRDFISCTGYWDYGCRNTKPIK